MRFENSEFAVEYERLGDGLPLVFLHGLAIDRRMLIDAFEPAFASGAAYSRLYLDLPGHGQSPPAMKLASADGLAHAVTAAIKDLVGANDFGLVAYSYGGYLAPIVAKEFSSLRGMFLVCPVVEPDFARRRAAPRRTLLREPNLQFSDDPREVTAFNEVAVVQTQAAVEAFQRVVHPANIVADQAFMAAVRDRYATVRPVLSALGRWDKPVSIVTGHDDHWVGYEDALDLMRALPRAGLTVLPDCGHLLPIESPQRLRSVFSDWLAQL